MTTSDKKWEEFTKEDILKILKNINPDKYKWKINTSRFYPTSKHNKLVYNLFCQDYPNLVQSLSDAYYWCLHCKEENFIDSLFCKVCGKRNHLMQLSYGYSKHCCQACLNKDKDHINKVNQSYINNYGTHIFMRPDIRKKALTNAKEASLKKYGIPYARNSSYARDIANESKRKNHTFNTSKDEKLCYELLQNKFSVVEYQYKCDRYPFRCDFYIPSIDTFIEYQGNWHHGDQPYGICPEDDERKLRYWDKRSKFLKENKGRTRTQYDIAKAVYTRVDVKKREVAKQNNLKYLEFFNMKQFYEWYNNIIGDNI